MTPAPFDPRALTEPVDPSSVRAYTRQHRDGGGSAFASAAAVIPIVVGVFAVVIIGSVFVTVASAVISTFASFGGGASVISDALATVLPTLLVVAVIAVIVVIAVRATRGRGERRYRLDRFAAANGMSYVPALQNPTLPGMIFGTGSSRASTDLVRGTQPRFVEFANYQYTTGSGKNRTTHRWGYVAIKLDVPLPNIVLDATSNNGLFGSNLPTTLDKDQRLSLEGDFDKYFALYCPEGYEQDALYLFTPDIMARFIDHAAALDVEIVDDWLFLYGKREFSSLDPATWSWLFSVVGALLDKFAQWARWRDERLDADAAPALAASAPASAPDAPTAVAFAPPVAALRPPPGVALSGRRLKRGISWPAIIGSVLVLIFWFGTQFGVFDLIFGWIFGN